MLAGVADFGDLLRLQTIWSPGSLSFLAWSANVNGPEFTHLSYSIGDILAFLHVFLHRVCLCASKRWLCSVSGDHLGNSPGTGLWDCGTSHPIALYSYINTWLFDAFCRCRCWSSEQSSTSWCEVMLKTSESRYRSTFIDVKEDSREERVPWNVAGELQRTPSVFTHSLSRFLSLLYQITYWYLMNIRMSAYISIHFLRVTSLEFGPICECNMVEPCMTLWVLFDPGAIA